MIELSNNNPAIWDEDGELVPLNPPPAVKHKADVAAIIVSRNRPDLVDPMVAQLKKMGRGLSVDIYVIEMGSEPEKVSQYASLNYDDKDFRGKCYGHNVGLRFARSKGSYRYYWILMNDLVFEDDVDTLGEMVRIAEADPKLAILSPTEPEGPYVACKPRAGSDYHLVTTCDYLALLVRASTVHDVGFLNPDFKYSWGAIHQLAFKHYSKGWQVAYCDRVTMKHLGGTTYGKVKGTVSRDEYQWRAKEFAARYFVEHYGRKWDEEFSKALPPEIETNNFPIHRQLWESVFEPEEAEFLPKAVPCKDAFPTIVRTIGDRLRKIVTKTNPTASLRQRIEDLHPWYYDVTIGGIKVTPGIGSKETPEQLIGRTRYCARLWVDEVAKRYNFKGKRLLDIGSNCGYYSARYAELGAASLVAVEGRADSVKQGWLYWNNNEFMKHGAYEFMHGNIVKNETWKQIKQRAPFDFTLCCGILYHIPDYEKVLRNAASVTREAMLIDTRVSDS
ncbi:MAG: methyltransferase domain-containing protein, partial [Candidatus Lindowbacteria bacterium]|nr:methyltransferase domain-containing protein [Candidatus Lindowbacteria bacterium]